MSILNFKNQKVRVLFPLLLLLVPLIGVRRQTNVDFWL